MVFDSVGNWNDYNMRTKYTAKFWRIVVGGEVLINKLGIEEMNAMDRERIRTDPQTLT